MLTPLGGSHLIDLSSEKLYHRNTNRTDCVTSFIFHLSAPRLNSKWTRNVPSRPAGNFTPIYLFLFIMNEGVGGGGKSETNQVDFTRRNSPTSSLHHFPKKGNPYPFEAPDA